MPMQRHVYAPTPATHTHLASVAEDLRLLEEEYSQYLEQDAIASDVQCLRSWVDAYAKGDAEAAEYLEEHGPALLENIQLKFRDAAREIQRIDEESPVSSNFSGGKSDRLNKAAEAMLHASDELAKAFHIPPAEAKESPIVTK